MSAAETPASSSPERARPEEIAGLLMESEHRGRYWWAAQLADGRDVLDAGCGSGYGTAILGEVAPGRVIGLDIATDAVEEAAAAFGETCSFVTGDVHELPMEAESFDLVVCFEVIEHITEQEKALDELRRVLRPGGVLAISSPNRGVYPSGNPFHVHEYTSVELAAVLNERFEHVRVYRQSPWLSSAILTDVESEAQGTSSELSVRAFKTAVMAPGEEMYAVALASDRELETPRSVIAFGESFEVGWWSDQLAESRRQIDWLSSQLADTRRAHDQLRDDWETRGGALLSAEAEIAAVRDEIAKLELYRGELEQWANREIAKRQARAEDVEQRLSRAEHTIADVTGSISWRLTAPLRLVKRRLRSDRTETDAAR